MSNVVAFNKPETTSSDVLLNVAGGELTMSSREIAELVEVRHDNVRRTIERLAERGVISLPPLEEVKVQRERREETVTVYHVNKRDSYIVVAQLSPEFTARLVDRWQELEEEAAKPKLPKNYLEALKALVVSEEDKQQLIAANDALTAENAVIAPKAKAMDRLNAAEGSMNITESAKCLKVKPKWLFTYLSTEGWIYRRAGGKNWLAYQSVIQVGYLEHKVTTVERPDGTEKVCEQVLVTPKGLAKLAKVLAAEGYVKQEAA